MVKPNELAVLQVNGQLYQDWESVSVRHCLRDHPFFTFRFTCSEGMPLSKNFGLLQIKPGDQCQVTLAGQPAVTGQVSTRQVFYDARRHHVEIQGASDTLGLAYVSAISQTGEHKDVTYDQYARALLKPFFPPIKFSVEGGALPQTKFPRISIPHGMSVMEALELPLRSIGGFPLTSSVTGGLVAAVGPPGGEDIVIEGQNILEGREVIFNPGIAHGLNTSGQTTGGDQKWGAQVAHVPFLSSTFQGMAAIKQYLPAVMPMDLPAFDKDHLQGRSNTERDMMAVDQVTVYATVQGWLKPSGGLWKCNQVVHVRSPMLLMTGSEPLQAKSITFTQDNERGSRTVLELCNPAAMGPGVPPE
jgi:prophage tail gpP-like protein